ncbi:MAG TPA: hypothetical protein VNJ53_08845 [Gaiellaceae bacterium]|nr:hypothetical protein [Gaiellaceae bacterium]
MSASYATWFAALGAGLVMLFLGGQMRMLWLPSLKVRCAACGRFVRRRGVCECSRKTSE